MLILFTQSVFLLITGHMTLPHLLSGVMIMYGFLIIMGVAWQVFQTHAWLLITFFVLTF